MDYLKKFLNHELLINIGGATVDDLKELDGLIKIDYCSGEKIYEAHLSPYTNKYLHCRVTTDGEQGLTFSEKPYDVYNGYMSMPFITYRELLDSFYTIDATPEEIERLFV